MEDYVKHSMRELGRSMLRAYKNSWIPRKRDMDAFIEAIVTQRAWFSLDPVEGGPPKIPQQELAMRIKQNNTRYQALITKIDRMERILAGMTDEELDIIEYYHWSGMPWHEAILRLPPVSKSTFFRRLGEIEQAVGCKWIDEVAKLGIDSHAKSCYNNNIGVRI